MGKKYYITTAITYASRKPHIGNTYEIVFTDAIARFKRMQGYDVHLCTGTDEHGQKVEDLAREQGIHPQEYVDRVSGEIRRIWDLMNASYDTFIRTTDLQHERIVQKIFKKLYDQGDIYKGTYEGAYCVPCESFWTQTQLVDGKCPDCGREVRYAQEEAYFFRMSKYQNRLMDYIQAHPNFIQPSSRRNEMINNFLKPGLQDLCVSRTSFEWGVSVDFDPRHVVYVWLDALINYITAIGYDPDGCSEQFQKLWPADVHMIGKDILRFHTIYWPIILMALDLPLPEKIFGHPWLLSGSDKMSKSVGNVMYADDLAEMFSVDAVRFYLLWSMPYAQDGSISYESIINVWNSELANTLGNLVKRTGDMLWKYFDGKVQQPSCLQPIDRELAQFADHAVERFEESMEQFKTSDALEAAMSLARRCNKYIDETEPWVLAKDAEQRERLATVLFHLLEGIRYIAVMLSPIMPDTSTKILDQIHADSRTLSSLKEFHATWVGTIIDRPEVLFARLDAEKKLNEIQKEIANTSQTSSPQPEKALASIDDFSKLKLIVAEVVECEKILKSNKLLKLQLNDGSGIRQVVSGIALWYTPEDLIGKKVALVANLKPVKLCGEKSEGMILAADASNHQASVLFLDSGLSNGAEIH